MPQVGKRRSKEMAIFKKHKSEIMVNPNRKRDLSSHHASYPVPLALASYIVFEYFAMDCIIYRE